MRRSRDDQLAQALPEVLREARARRGVSQEELADLAKVDRTVISRVESGQRLPSLGVFVAIAYAVHETPPNLLDAVLKRLPAHASS